MFSDFEGEIECFAYDWLGRQFAVYRDDLELILMFEPGTAEILKIPFNIVDFHNKEIIEYQDACLASLFYDDYMAYSGIRQIDDDKCVGYKVPLFLGGEDELSNLELIDIEVYWEINSQLINL